MGFLNCVEPHSSRLVFPGTPPELVSPSSSTYSSRASEAAPASPPPMAHYEQPDAAHRLPGKPSEAQPPRRSPPPAHGAAAWHSQLQSSMPQPPQQPKQVLPPLSSILKFSEEGRSQRSPLFDEPRPTYSAASSPLDRPHHVSGGPHPPERSYSSSSTSSYFLPSATPSTAPRSGGPFESRIEERSPFSHSLPRSSAFPGPISPQTREPERNHQQHHLRREGDLRAEYGSRDLHHQHQHPYQTAPPSSSSSTSGTASAQQHPQHQHRFPPPITILGNKHYGDLQIIQSSHGPQPPTPAGTVVHVPEGIPGKDALGPKIWTGTHFLPRFVRAAEVPGEGMCYFYDDGSHCKTVIDGEAVNAHWGVTKAGKPRKRLAIACVTCREKKIKCDPDFPRCVQCEKFGRHCKFKNAPRGGTNASPSSPPADLDDSPHSISSRRMGEPFPRRTPGDPPRPGSNSSASVSPRTMMRPASPEMLNTAPSKRPRISYEHQLPTPHSLPPLQLQQNHPRHHQSQYQGFPHPNHALPSIEGLGNHRGPVLLPPLPTKPLPDPSYGSKPTATTMPPTTLGWSQSDLPRIHDDYPRRAWHPEGRHDAPR